MEENTRQTTPLSLRIRGMFCRIRFVILYDGRVGSKWNYDYCRGICNEETDGDTGQKNIRLRHAETPKSSRIILVYRNLIFTNNTT